MILLEQRSGIIIRFAELDNSMKYIYVLTSSEKDTYYEQFYLSIASLRLYNPDAFIIALIDEKTKQGLSGKRAGYEKLVSETRVIKVPDEYSQKEASRWIKTSIYNHVHHHVTGDFLFVDCDTIITGSLDHNFPLEIKIGAVLDTHVLLNEHHLQKYFQREDKSVGFNSSLVTNIRYNGGLIFYRNNAEAYAFFEKWHSLWTLSVKKGCSQDMPALNQANYELGNIISELGGEWNCQISHNGLPFLQNAKIIHCFASTLNSTDHAYKLASHSVLSSIKQTGEISAEIMKMLENPKTAFQSFSRIVSDKSVIDALDSLLFFKMVKFFRRHPLFLKKWNAFTSFLTRFFKKVFQ